MTSSSFPCKYAGVVCVKCGEPVAIGSMIRFVTKGSKDKEHENCPKDKFPFQETAPPVRSSTGPGEPKEGTSSAPAEGQAAHAPDRAEQRGASPEGFMYVGFWIPPSKVDLMVRAFKEARA